MLLPVPVITAQLLSFRVPRGALSFLSLSVMCVCLRMRARVLGMKGVWR